ncbi:GTP-binding protein [Nitrogeniibacter mangrovi]|uniref:GTP-binding protein n=1 Tax=Nitrogeniibacter mangrovi TaxID=2016596 RepID=A0A6C1AYG0_9RHOO|nr:GTP-binding protein [Nitrogeniibacter mangrovi]QID16402.1 GTP-binding protein [Nitrogeniibacter mangrovi]
MASTTTTSANPTDRIPVTVLTGFLGAGKTTLLNQLVRQPDMANAAVLINEFGEVGLDHHLVDSVDENIVLLDSGCVCCSMQGDLVQALQTLSNRSSRRDIPPITRVLIETTGLADPAPVIYTLMEHEFVSARYVCDGIVTVVDATHGLAQLNRHREALRQASMADRLLITKTDLTDAATLAALEVRLEAVNPGTPRRIVRSGQIRSDMIFGAGIYTKGTASPEVATWLDKPSRGFRTPQRTAGTPAWRPGNAPGPRRAERHDLRVRSFVIELPATVPWYGFAATMGRILDTHGDKLLRVKGLVAVYGTETQPLVIHCVQNVAYPAVRLDAWPPGEAFADRHGRMVFIVQDLSEADEAGIRAALAHLPADSVAARTVAASPWLPTKCWLSQWVATTSLPSYQVDGWIVQTRRPRRL